ncbi:MAG: hypothetical protein HYV99_07275, partial [Betaproteobacteria bacterium]|nr:hypothetical protein [Betaproteobacteria bacterium]
ASVREAFEEAGILLAGDGRGGLVDTAGAESGGRFRSHRNALNAGRQEFAAMMQGEGLRLAAGRLTYFSHWITPVGAPRRYDTRFFLAAAPERQEASHDGGETIAHAWLRPAAALDARAKGESKLRVPTIRTLESFAGFASVGSLAAGLRGQGSISPLLPRLTRDGRSLLPGEPGYEETGGEGSWKI